MKLKKDKKEYAPYCGSCIQRTVKDEESGKFYCPMNGCKGSKEGYLNPKPGPKNTVFKTNVSGITFIQLNSAYNDHKIFIATDKITSFHEEGTDSYVFLSGGGHYLVKESIDRIMELLKIA